MSDEAPTKPMLETILEEMRAGFESMDKRLIDTKAALSALEARFSNIENRFSNIETRISNIEHRLDIIETQLVHMDARSDRFESIALGLRGISRSSVYSPK